MLKPFFAALVIMGATFTTAASAWATEINLEDARSAELCLSDTPIDAEEWQTCMLQCFSSPTTKCLLATAAAMTDKLGDARQADFLHLQISSVLTQIGNAKAALETVEKISDPGMKDQARARIAIIGAETGNIATVLQAAPPTSVQLVMNDNMVLSRKLIGALAKTQAMMGNVPGALHTAAAAYDPEDGGVVEFADALRSIAVAQDNARVSEDAIRGSSASSGMTWIMRRLFGRYPWRLAEKWGTDYVIYELAMAGATTAIETGDLASALQIADASPDLIRVLVLTAISIREATLGNDASALEAVAGARKAAGSLSEGWQQIVALGSVAVAQAQAGNRVAAQESMAEVLRVFERDRNKWWDRAQSLERMAIVAIAQAKSGDIAAARTTLATAKETAGTLDEVLRFQALGFIAVAQSEIGDDAGARATLDEKWTAISQMEDEPAYALSLVGLAQAAVGNQSAAEDAYGKAMERALKEDDQYSRAHDLLNAARVLAMAGEQVRAKGALTEAYKAWQQSDDMRIRELWFRRFARIATEIGDFPGALDFALRTAREVSRADLRAHALSTIARTLGTIGDQTGAKHVLGEALNAALQTRNASDRALALADVARAQSQTEVQMQKGAGVTLAEALMAADLLRRDSRAWALRATASSRAEEGRIADALATAEWAVGERERVLIYVEVATIQNKNGDPAGALETISRVLELIAWDASPEEIAWAATTIAGTQLAMGDESGALDSLLQAAEAVERIYDSEERIWNIIGVAKVLSEMGYGSEAGQMLAAAESMAEELVDATAIPHVQFGLAGAWAEAADFSKALRLAEKIADLTLRARTLAVVASAQADEGNQREALQTVGVALDAIGMMDEETSEFRLAVALNAIASAQARAGNEQGARETYVDALEAAEKVNHAFRSNVLYSIARAQVTEGNLAAALLAAERIDNAVWRSRALNDIGKAQLEMGDEESAKRTFTSAVNVLNQIDLGKEKSSELGAIAIAYLEAGDIAGALGVALRTAREISDASERASALALIAGVQADTGPDAGARTTLNEAVLAAAGLRSPIGRARSLGLIASAQAGVGDEASATDTLAAALEAVAEIDWMSMERRVVAAIEAAQAEHGDISGAVQGALWAVSYTKDPVERAYAQTFLASAQAALGDEEGARESLAEAAQTAQTSESDYDYGSANVLRHIAAMQAEMGDVEAAMATVQSIRYANYFIEAIVSVAGAVPRAQ